LKGFKHIYDLKENQENLALLPIRDALRAYRTAFDTKIFLSTVKKMKENNFDLSTVQEVENDLREMNDNLLTEFEKVRSQIKIGRSVVSRK
jgi:hypothetical protein